MIGEGTLLTSAWRLCRAGRGQSLGRWLMWRDWNFWELCDDRGLQPHLSDRKEQEVCHPLQVRNAEQPQASVLGKDLGQPAFQRQCWAGHTGRGIGTGNPKAEAGQKVSVLGFLSL